MAAARATAGAVLRPTGSETISIGTVVYSATWRALSRACCTLVTIMILFGTRGRTRSTVRCSMDFPPNTDISCFGVLVRESGQKRVPEPPAMMATYITQRLFAADVQRAYFP